jgi:hypothetical protein
MVEGLGLEECLMKQLEVEQLLRVIYALLNFVVEELVIYDVNLLNIHQH